MDKFIKWLFSRKMRSYKFEYIAYGFMGNRYSAGIYEFKVSDGHLKDNNLTPSQYGFSKHYDELIKHYPVAMARKIYSSINLTNIIQRKEK